MAEIAFEILLIVLLMLINGIFAMTEIAMVSARKGKLHSLSQAGSERATLALALAESPNRFLSTVQIGITAVGIFAGAYGGATLASVLAAGLRQIPAVAPYAQSISIAGVVAGITFLSLLIGELVPKRIGLAYPEQISLAMARPMHTLSIIAGPLVRFLATTSDLLLRVFGVRQESRPAISEQEVQALMQEGLRAGAFNRVESLIVRSALELDQLFARDLMTPRPKITWVSKSDTHETIWHKIVVSGHSHFPVYEGNRDNVVGIVSLKAIYANVAAGVPARVADLMTTPLIVPDSQPVVQLLETFKSSGKHIAVVADEFGGMVGLVTLHDIMEAVIGEFPTREERAKPRIKRRDDGSWLIDAIIPFEEVEAAIPDFAISESASGDYQTLAGFVVKQLGRMPTEGETFHWKGFTVEVLDMDRHRVDKVLIMRALEGGRSGADPAI